MRDFVRALDRCASALERDVRANQERMFSGWAQSIALKAGTATTRWYQP
jgi:hypothetical protein